jgi:hypothetical protein
MNKIKNFKDFLVEKNQLSENTQTISPQESEIMKLFSTPIAPVIKKISEWMLHHFLENGGEYHTFMLVVSPSGKELVYSVGWEFDSDLPDDFGPDTLKKALPSCEIMTLNEDHGMPSFLTEGVACVGGNIDWIEEVGEFLTEPPEDNSSDPEKEVYEKYTKYGNLFDDMRYVIQTLNLHPEDFLQWASSGLSVADYNTKYAARNAARKYGL